MSALAEAITDVLRGAGLTDKPAEFGSNIHSWRCRYPDTYGACDCFAELVSDLCAAATTTETTEAEERA